jgi:metal-sulfur cluster biosynthetic enzyme
MGLVHDIEQDQGNVHVRLLLTDPMCLYLFEMRSQIIEVLSALPGSSPSKSSRFQGNCGGRSG